MSSVPAGIIAVWTGSEAEIPGNWNLCDGSNGTPDLRYRFIKGALTNADIGSTGGSDTHAHTLASAGYHGHTMPSAGSHSHSVDSKSADHLHGELTHQMSDGATTAAIGVYTGASHAHSTSTDGGHSHDISEEGSHSHTTSSVDHKPPYYTVACIQAGVSADIEDGIILLWANASDEVPDNWEVETAFQERFFRGDTSGGTAGGNTSHSHSTGSAGSHGHTVGSAGDHDHGGSGLSSETWHHSHNRGVSMGSDYSIAYQTSHTTPSHTHSISISSAGSHSGHSIGSDGSHSDHSIASRNNLPGYIDALFIKCSGAATIPQNGIVMWAGEESEIPPDYTLCDGGEGRPDYRNKFIRGAPSGQEPGGSGGSLSHDHDTSGYGGLHEHSVSGTSGSHNHGSGTTGLGGSHEHSWVAQRVGLGTTYQVHSFPREAGAHNHGYELSEGNHGHADLQSGGSHNHAIDVKEHEPAYYSLAFIMYEYHARGFAWGYVIS